MLPSNSNKKRTYGVPESLKARKTTQASTPSKGRVVNGRYFPSDSERDSSLQALVGYDSKNSGLMNAAMVAASLLPIPGLKGVALAARGAKAATTAGKAPKVATTASKSAKPAGKLSKAEARDVELREIKRLMQPEPRPAREVTRFSVDDDIRRAMRGKSGKVMSTGPKPVRSAFKSDSAFKTAMKGWEKTLEANRSAVRSGGDSLPVAKNTTPAPVAKKTTPAPRKQTPAPVAKKTTVKRPSAKKKTEAPAVKQQSEAPVKKNTPAPVAKKTTVKRPSVKKPPSGAATSPSKELVRVPSNSGRKAGGPSVSTNNRIPLPGKPSSTSRDIAVSNTPARELVVTKIQPVKPSGVAKKKMSKKKKVAIGAAGTTAALYGGGEALKRLGKSKDTAGASSTVKPNSRAGRKASVAFRNREGLLDQYGRKISRAEFNRREAYRASKTQMSPKERAAAEKKEMARRKEYREGVGAKRFGASATTKTRKVFATRLDERARKSIR